MIRKGEATQPGLQLISELFRKFWSTEGNLRDIRRVSPRPCSYRLDAGHDRPHFAIEDGPSCEQVELIGDQPHPKRYQEYACASEPHCHDDHREEINADRQEIEKRNDLADRVVGGVRGVEFEHDRRTEQYGEGEQSGPSWRIGGRDPTY